MSFVQVMKILLRNHGSYLNGVKSDLYTLIGEGASSLLTLCLLSRRFG